MVPRCAATSSWSHVLMLVLCLSAAQDFHRAERDRHPFHYGSFPAGFPRASGSSAYQAEGTWDAGAKGVSNWESFSHKKEKIIHSTNQDSPCNGCHKVKKGISLLKELKLNGFLSWAQKITAGRKADPMKEKWRKYHDASVNILLENRITLVVTMHQWDLPDVHKVWHSHDAHWCSAQTGNGNGQSLGLSGTVRDPG